MHRKKRIDQVKVTYRNHHWSLEETLRPWWRVTRWGILLDWCYPNMDYEHRLVKIARYTGVLLVSLLLFTMAVFHVFRLCAGVVTMTTLHSVVPHIVWCASFPIALVTHLCYVFNSKEYLTFFEDWSKFENQLALRNNHASVIPKLKKARLLTVVLSLTMKFGMISTLGYVVIFHYNTTYLLSYYQSLQDIFTLPVLSATHLICILIIFILKNLCETVPSLIFYHAGLEVRILQEEIQDLFLTFDPSSNCAKPYPLASNSSIFLAVKMRIRHISNSYENLRSLVARANSLFGLQIFLSYAMEFVVIGTLVYTNIYGFRENKIHKMLVYSIILIINLFDLVSCNLLTSKIFHASQHLRTVLASLLNRDWDSITKNERDILFALLDCLRSDPLAASPLGLFRVTPSILLNMTSLIMSYVIIMLQSK